VEGVDEVEVGLGGDDFAGEAEVGEAVAAVAGDFDIEEGVVEVIGNGVDGEANGHEDSFGLGGIDGSREEGVEPAETDFHGDSG
jgi:hypothetical protein